MFSSWVSLWYTQADLKLFYDTLYIKIEVQTGKNDEKTALILQTIDQRLKQILLKTSNSNNKRVLHTLITLNQNQLTSLQKPSISITSQKNHPSYITTLLGNGYTYIELSPQLEFIQNNETYRLNFKKYFELSSQNYKHFIKNKLTSSVIVYFKNGYILTNDFVKERKYTFFDLEKTFSHVIDIQKPYFLENGVYYTYKYNYYIIFQEDRGLYESDLIANKINPKQTLLIKDWEKYFFSNDYNKIKLVSSDIIANISNKEEFLFNISDDNKFNISDADSILREIKKDTQMLVSWVNHESEKIRLIYRFLINRVVYYENYSDGNKQIYSGVLTYKNKTGVCDGYVKLFLYMLSFAGVSDVEVKRGFAYDNQDFPNFWHAWVKIGNMYYDPTFDDPIGGNGNGSWYYFELPYELMYTNRFDGIVIPENLKNMPLTQRKNLVAQNIYKIYDKYRSYPLLYTVRNKIFLWFKYDQKITLSSVIQNMKVLSVKRGTFVENGYRFTIRSLNYYLLTESNVENILSNPKIDLSDMYLFLWYKNDGTFEYRLAYDVIFE